MEAQITLEKQFLQPALLHLLEEARPQAQQPVYSAPETSTLHQATLMVGELLLPLTLV